LLDEEEKKLFRRLSIFEGGFDYEAVEFICCDLECDPYDLTDSLLSKNLFKKDDNINDASRYSMLNLIHDYAAELFDKSEEKESIKLRHADFYLKRSEKDIPAFSGVEQHFVSKKWEADVENVLEALSTFMENKMYNELVNMIYALWPLFWVYNHDGELTKKIDLLLVMHSASDLSDEVSGKLTWLAGAISLEQGEYVTAEYFLTQAKNYFGETDNKRGIAWTIHLLLTIDIAAHPERSNEEILNSFDSSAKLFRECGDLGGVSMTILTSAVLESRSGDNSQALKFYDECFLIAKKMGNNAMQGHTTTMKAWPYMNLNEYDKAHLQLRDGMEFFKEGKYPESFSYCLEMMSYYYFKINNDVYAMKLLGAYKNIMMKYQFNPWSMLSLLTDFLDEKLKNSTGKLAEAFEEGFKMDIYKSARLAYKLVNSK
jgi:non-specific serine/threonine protein kinase